MTLDQYLADLTAAERLKFAKRLRVHPVYVSAIAAGRRQAGPKLAIQIEQVTEQSVPRWEVRSDLWARPAEAASSR